MNSKGPELVAISPIKSPFTIIIKQNVLKIIIAHWLRDAQWAAYFGVIQNALRKREWHGNPIESIIIDMRTCYWADPIPVLSLLLSIAEFTDKNGHVKMMLPSGKNEAEKRFLKYLSREGFLEHILKAQDKHLLEAYWGDEKLTMNAQREFVSAALDLAYNQSTCLRAELLTMGTSQQMSFPSQKFINTDQIDNWVVNKLENIVDPVIKSQAPIWTQPSIKYRLQLFLRETLHNVLEHAYVDGGYAGIYVRYRHGELGVASHQKNAMEESLHNEDDDALVPLLPRSFVQERHGFFEAFVVDAGHGICKTLAETIGAQSDLQHFMLAVLRDGKSRKKHRRQLTYFGGLRLVREVLEPNGDYIRVMDNNAWWGSRLPVREPSPEPRTKNAFGELPGQMPIEGLTWTTRLSWRQYSDTPDQKYWLGCQDRLEHPLLNEFLRSDDNYEQFKLIPILDFRFSESNQTMHRRLYSEPSVGIILPPERLMKREIRRLVEKSKILTLLSHNSVLIIGDISSLEACTYLTALHNYYIYSPHANIGKISKIILVTRRLNVCILRRKDNSFVFEETYAKQFVKCQDINPFDPSVSLRHYFRLLRWHDSNRFWATLKKEMHADPAFVRGIIRWTPGTELRDYIDFAQTLTNSVCRKIYAISLHRLPALFPNEHCDIIPLDYLVESQVVRLNALQKPVYGDHTKIKRLLIGSVQVTGLTEKLAEPKTEITKSFHFFRHPESTTNTAHLLLWPKRNEDWWREFDERERYARIGRTPVIAKDGWKSFKMPRYREDKDGIVSVYQKGPNESYKEWQELSRPLMKLGHWKYGVHHDLLTLNLLLAFDSELDLVGLPFKGGVARYVFYHFVSFLDISESDMNEEGLRVLEKIREEYLIPHKEKTTKIKAYIIYPSHPVTDHVIEKFLSLLVPLSHNKLRTRMIGLWPVQRNRSVSALLLSGLISERLNSIAQEKNARIMIFDDAVITGRTYEEIKELLRSKGYRDVRSLTLLDRQRLPSSSYLLKNKRDCYWRFDVPPLGNDRACPLCSALEITRNFQNVIVSFQFADRINEWLEEWIPLSSITNWADGGVIGMPLQLSRAEKKFGIVESPDEKGMYRQIGGDQNRIRITNSVGLVAYVSEFHAMTSRDDLPERILNQEPELPLQAKIHLLSSQILLFNRELDKDSGFSLCYNLLYALYKSNNEDKNTSLAGLTLLCTPGDSVTMALSKLLEDEGDNLDLQNTGIDFLLVLAFFIHNGTVLDSPRLQRVTRALASAPNLAAIYTHFHREVKDDFGKCHREPLHRLVEPDRPLELNRIATEAANSASRLIALLNKSEIAFRIRPTLTYQAFKELRDKSETNANDIVTAVRKYLQKGEPVYADDKDKDFIAIQKLGALHLSMMDKIHESLFQPIGLESIVRGLHSTFITNTLVPLCKEIENENWSSIAAEKKRQPAWDRPVIHISKIKSYYIKENIKEAYIIWDEDVHRTVRAILTNVLYADELINNPDRLSENEIAHLWIRCTPLEEFFMLELFNHSADHAEEIQKKSKGRNRLHEIGGNISFDSCEPQVVKTIIKIPYAHTVQQAIMNMEVKL